VRSWGQKGFGLVKGGGFNLWGEDPKAGKYFRGGLRKLIGRKENEKFFRG